MSGTLLEARGVRTGYGRLPVVFNVDLEVKEGEIVALLGANASRGRRRLSRALSSSKSSRFWNVRAIFSRARLCGLRPRRSRPS